MTTRVPLTTGLPPQVGRGDTVLDLGLSGVHDRPLRPDRG